MTRHDVVVAGGGIAGLSAGTSAARLGLSTLVLTGTTLGGHMMSVEGIEDFPGFADGVTGYDLCPSMQMQAAGAGADFAMEELRGLRRDGDEWIVMSDSGERRAGAVILATGSSLRELGVPGEERLTGRGISHCASCDGPFFRDAVVAVVGGGDSACQEALTLTAFAASVIMFVRGDALHAQHTYAQRVAEHAKIETRFGMDVEEILGDAKVEGLRARPVAGGEAAEIALSAVFPCVGLKPRTGFLAGVLELDAEGRIPTDALMRTAEAGLFAAGDIRTESIAQAVAAAGDGATAAFAAQRYLRDRLGTENAALTA